MSKSDVASAPRGGGTMTERRRQGGAATRFEVGGRVGSGFGKAAAAPAASANSTAETAAASVSSSSLLPDDPSVRGETFHGHWMQMRGIAAMQKTVPTVDDMVAVLNLLDQMTTLLQMELEAEKLANICSTNSNSDGSSNILSRRLEEAENPLDSIREPKMPCLDLLLSDNILSHVLATSRMPIDDRHADQLRQQQLLLYETLLGSDQAHTLLSHQPFLKPMLELLNHFRADYCDFSNVSPVSLSGQSSKETELHLVLVLNLLCKRLMDNLDLLDFFFMASREQRMRETSAAAAAASSKSSIGVDDDDDSHFLIFSILVKFLHKEGNVGQLARDALLHCMSLSRKNEDVGEYIAKHSNFCTVLATGLSGLYSLLPRNLPKSMIQDPSWVRISAPDGDLQSMPELSTFLSSLHFCDAVVQVAHAKVREHLLGLIYMGFLVPVMGPALTQSSENEVICTSAYLDLFLRNITEPSLLKVFLSFIFVDSCDDRSIIDTITIRISSQTKLCQVTLSLFETFLNLHCEDVMLCLVFRHLIPLKHLVPSMRGESIRMPDIHGRAAERLLSLAPICCQEAAATYAEQQQQQQRTNLPQSSAISFPQIFPRRSSNSIEASSGATDDPSSSALADHFHLYLKDARVKVRQCVEASGTWQYKYDGLSPPADALVASSADSSVVVAEGSGRKQQRLSDEGCNLTATGNNEGEEGEDDGCDNGDGSILHSTAIGDCTAPSSGYTSLALLSSSPSMSGPVSMTAEEDREFWNLMKDPTVSEVRLNKVIQRMQQHDELSLSSSNAGCNHSRAGSNAGSSDGISPRRPSTAVSTTAGQGGPEEVDYTITSLGCFLDLLLEKVELMSSNSLTTNLLVTSLLSHLSSFPHPLLRSVLTQPDIIFQPSVRGLYTAIASLRQKLDNIMPTLPMAEAAIIEARRFLQERVEVDNAKRSMAGGAIQRRESSSSGNSMATVAASAISHIGHEASRHRSTFSAAFTSIFGSGGSSSSNKKRSSSSSNNRNSVDGLHNRSAPSSIVDVASPVAAATPPQSVVYRNGHSSQNSSSSPLTRETKKHALAAVLLEEWLMELAAIAQEQSVLQKERAFEVGLLGGMSNARTMMVAAAAAKHQT